METSSFSNISRILEVLETHLQGVNIMEHTNNFGRLLQIFQSVSNIGLRLATVSPRNVGYLLTYLKIL